MKIYGELEKIGLNGGRMGYTAIAEWVVTPAKSFQQLWKDAQKGRCEKSLNRSSIQSFSELVDFMENCAIISFV